MHNDEPTAQNSRGQAFGSISAYLARDHAEIGTLLDAIIPLVDSGAFELAEDRYNEFRRRLRRHVEIEERVVFPVWERRFGRGPGPTQVMRHEHRQITAEVEAMRAALNDRDAAAFGGALCGFTSLMGRHNAKEESFLYPGIDKLLTPDEHVELLARAVGE